MGYKYAEVQSALSGKAVILKGKWGSKWDNYPRGIGLGGESTVVTGGGYVAKVSDIRAQSQTAPHPRPSC